MTIPVRSKALRASAQGQACTLRFGVCSGVETVVGCHIKSPMDGIMGDKPSDLAMVYGCYACHMILDGVDRSWKEIHPGDREAIILRALIETHEVMVSEGLISVPS